jgi:hypothetical protein
VSVERRAVRRLRPAGDRDVLRSCFGVMVQLPAR